MDFNYRAERAEPRLVRRSPHCARDGVIVDMRRIAARIADHEDTIVDAVRVRIGQIGIGAFDSPREIGSHEQVENAVNRIGGNAPPLGLRHGLGDVIGRRGALEARQRIEHAGAHVGPLLA